jgi:two-component system, OmpR family, alkaline phosphatase synthesis response regulator PhoP
MKRILVVEDDNYLSSAYKAKLIKMGYDVQIAGDGDEALEVLKNYKPDLILLDLIMPVKDGFITLGEIKKNEELKSIPVLIATNLGQKEDIEKGMKMGAVDYLVKTDTSIENFVNKIQTILGT